MADAPEIVEKSITFEAAPERLWSMLTEQESFASWYAFGGATIEAEPGGVLAVHWQEHGTFRGEVMLVESPRRFGYRLAAVPEEDPQPQNSTVVEFTIEPADGGSALTVRHSGFEDLEGIAADSTSAEIETMAWTAALPLLREALGEAPVEDLPLL